MAAYKPKKSDVKGIIIEALKRVFGDKCHICGMAVEERKRLWPALKEWLLEHRDGNPDNYDFENCQLACYKCNRLKVPESTPETGNVERENTAMSASTTEEQRKRRYLKRATPEFAKSVEIEPLVRRYLWEQVSREGSLILDDAIPEAAEYANCDVQTAKRKIDKATSRMGPFEVVTTSGGTDLIKLRQRYEPNVQTEMGRLDYAISQELFSRLKNKAESTEKQAVEVMTVQARMADSLNYIAKQRDIAIREVARVTGKSYDEVKAMLDSQAPPPTHHNSFDDEAPAAPVQIDKSGDEPPAVGAVAVKKKESPGIA